MDYSRKITPPSRRLRLPKIRLVTGSPSSAAWLAAVLDRRSEIFSRRRIDINAGGASAIGLGLLPRAPRLTGTATESEAMFCLQAAVISATAEL